jgi:probable phosphoglycerate mutase
VNQPSLFAAPGPLSAAANIDGGSRGNPGPAGYGVRIQPEGAPPIDIKESLGTCTNNVAEYRGLLAALRWAVAHGCTSLHVRSDSLLLVQQMKGVYRVKHPGLQPLFEEARALARQIGRVTFEHVRREFNKDADRLANEAMDEAAASQP